MSDLQALFNTDPHQLTSQDLDTIIAYYREARKAFNLEGKSAKSAKATKEKVTTVDLDELLG